MFVHDDGHEEPTTGSSAAAAAQAARPRLTVTMTKFRGPGDVKFDDNTPAIGTDGKATANATFSQPGEYFIRVEGNDSSGVGGGGFQCCWSTVYFKVSVKPGNTAR